MRQDKIELYLAGKGINASYGTLGSTDALIKLFVKENAQTIRETTHRKSNYIKHQLYSKYYEFEERPKFTGFEKFAALDKKSRFDNRKVGHGLVGMPIIRVTTENVPDGTVTLIASPILLPGVTVEGSYLEELKSTLKTYNNPLLYLSGGIDSEFVARAMLDAGIQFKVVIFRLTDDQHDVLNAQDILYALDFCEEHGLIPIINTICIPDLWASKEFADIAKGTESNSPQLNTHAYMAEVMAKEFPDSAHLFGGEIRVLTQIDQTDSTLNIVNAVKVATPGYDGFFYTLNYTTSTPSIVTQEILLSYFWSGFSAFDQQWNTSVTGPGTLVGGPTLGNWFNGQATPNTGFQYYSADIGPPIYAPLATGYTTMALVASVGTRYTNSTTGVVQTGIWVKSNIDSAEVVSTFWGEITYTYTGPPAPPVLLTYDTAGTFTSTWTDYGYQNLSYIVVGAGGAGMSGHTSGVFTNCGGGGSGGQVRSDTWGPGLVYSLLADLGDGGTNNVLFTPTVTNGRFTVINFSQAGNPGTGIFRSEGGTTATSLYGNGASGTYGGAGGGGAGYSSFGTSITGGGGGGGCSASGTSAIDFYGGAGGAGQTAILNAIAHNCGGGGGGAAYSGAAGTATYGGGAGALGTSGGVIGSAGTNGTGGGGGGSFSDGISWHVNGGQGGTGLVVFYMTV